MTANRSIDTDDWQRWAGYGLRRQAVVGHDPPVDITRWIVDFQSPTT